MLKKLIYMLFSVCGVLVFANDSATAFKPRVSNIGPNTYVDFQVVAKDSLSVIISNDVACLPEFRLKVPKLAESTDSHVLGLRRYREKGSLYIDGQLATSFDDKYTSNSSVLIPADAIPEEADEEYIQKLGQFSFSDAFMVAEGDKTGLQNWETLAGYWSLHSVTGRAIHVSQKTTLNRFPTQERSPNFYSLNGFGKNAAIIAGESFYSHYAFRAALQQTEGTNGLAFLVSDEGKGFTFTAQTDPKGNALDFILRSDFTAGESAGKFEAGVKTELTPGQWYMLEVRLLEDEVICYVDNIAVIRKKLSLPAGGRFGLFSNTLEAQSARFDDVSAETWTGTDFSLSSVKGLKKEDCFGCGNDPPAAITLPAQLENKRTVELFAGKSSSKYTFRVENAAEKYKALLVSSLNGLVTTNDQWTSATLPGLTNECGMSEFTLDTTKPGIIAGRINNITVVMACPDTPVTGPAGYKTDLADKKIAFPSVSRQPNPYTDRFEKNKIFVEDPYMKVWASTEGQWLSCTNGTSWYKDDILNRMSMTLPTVDGLDLRLGTSEDGTICDIRVLCESNTLSVFSGISSNLFNLPYPPCTLKKETGELSEINNISLHFDGFRFALSTSTGTVFNCQIPYPHSGRRMYFVKDPGKYTRNILIHREPVIDCLFSESLHDWTINGGTWEINNRFQCYPDWSYMNGEGADSIAALWSKYEVDGDFCAMFVCGIRHGWYNRVGDFNLTIFNKSNTPSDGYTLKITDWDPDHSQQWSRLFRNGTQLVKTDVKAAPRRREGNVRYGYEPMLDNLGNKDVHRAWYSLKFRKLGNRLETIFDNIPLFSYTDPSPLHCGSLGIWTYRNSMEVGRIRIAAESVRPRKFKFSSIESDNAITASTTQCSKSRPLYFNGYPIDLLAEKSWHADDNVNSPELTFSIEDGEDVMTMKSCLGSGTFLSIPALPQISVDKLAGWSFEVARSPRSQFNFEFSYSCENQQNLFSHIICGSNEIKGPRHISGKSDIPPATPLNSDKKIWTPVTVWLPSTGSKPKDTIVTIDGLGNLQPSDVQQGLYGNGPGEWYAIRRFRPIYRDTPYPDNSSSNSAAFAMEIRTALNNGKAAKLNTYQVPKSISPSKQAILWVLPPSDNQGLIAKYHDTPFNFISISSTLEWPNQLLSIAGASINDHPVPQAYIENSTLFLPYERPFAIGTSPVKVSFTTTDGRPFTQFLPAAAFNPTPDLDRAPIITSVTFPQSIGASYDNFESRSVDPTSLKIQNTNCKLRYGDVQQNSYLHFSNDGWSGRLAGAIRNGFSILKSPFVQFRYRGDPLAIVNITPRNNSIFHFSDGYGGQQQPSVLDDNWHTAICRLTASDFELGPTEAFSRPTNPLSFHASGITGRSGIQSGPFSYFDIDDVAIAPAIGPNNISEFTFLTKFETPDGISTAEYAITEGLQSYASLPTNITATIAWTSFDPASTNMIAPQIGDIKNGIHHLLIRAKSAKGTNSNVADIPFVYDAEPPYVTCGIVTNNPNLFHGYNMVLRVIKDPNGSAPTLAGCRMTIDGNEMTPFNGNFGKAPGQFGKANCDAGNNLTYTINWPRFARDVIQSSTNGAVINFKVENISDGCGNIAPPITTQVKIDYASDHTPPFFTEPLKRLHFTGTVAIPGRESFFKTFGEGLIATHYIAKENGYGILSIKNKGLPDPKARWKYAAVFPFNEPWIAPTNQWLMFRCRIPEKGPASTNIAFKLNFTASVTPKDAATPSKNNIYTMQIPSVTTTNTASRPTWLYGNLDFTPGKWNEVALDVNDFMQTTAGSKGEFRLNRLALQLPDIADYALEFDAAVISKNIPSKKKFRINVDAEDRSGVDGLYCGNEKICDKWSMLANEFYEKFGEKMFIDLKVRDRAGNFTTKPLIIALPPKPPAE